MTSFSLSQELAASPAEALAAMADPSWYDAVRETPTAWAPTLEAVESEGGNVVAVIRYRFRGTLNRAASKVLDPGRLTHLDRITIDPRAATFSWDVRPEQLADRLSITAGGRVEPGRDGARRILTGAVEVRYPLVGRQVERAIVKGLEEHAEHERRAFSAWMGGGGPSGPASAGSAR